MAFRAEIDDFAAFYASAYQRAFRTARAIVGDAASADDVTQDAFVAAYRTRDRFRGDRTQVVVESNLGTGTGTGTGTGGADRP